MESTGPPHPSPLPQGEGIVFSPKRQISSNRIYFCRSTAMSICRAKVQLTVIYGYYDCGSEVGGVYSTRVGAYSSWKGGVRQLLLRRNDLVLFHAIDQGMPRDAQEARRSGLVPLVALQGLHDDLPFQLLQGIAFVRQVDDAARARC